jgi:peroxiredoxin
MMRFILCTLFSLVVLTAFSAPTIIQGNAFSYRGQNIEIHQYLDLFTFRTLELADQHIPENGNFKFNIDIKKSGLYLAKIGKVYAHLFVSPGDEYTLVIPEPYEEDKYSPAKDIFVMPEIFESNQKLNFEITKIEQQLNRFIIDYSYMYKSGGVSKAIRKPADSLASELNKRYSENTDIYLKQHLHYRLAEFELMIGKSKKVVYNKYLKDTPPAFDCLSYSNVFNNFYREAMYPGAPNKYSDALEMAFEKNNFSRIDSILSEDTTLFSAEVNDLLLANQLYLLGAEKIYALHKIEDLLDSIKLKTKSQDVMMIAQNAQELLMTLAPGTRAPDFRFSDVVGNFYRFDEYEGAMIYVQFFDRFTPEALQEMSLMKVLKKGYGSDIAFFSISLSESPSRLKKIAEDQGFSWFFGSATSANQLREAYDLRALPAYFFIDEEMKFVRSPAPAPGAEIEKAFAKEWQIKHPNKPLLFKLQPPEVTGERVNLPEGVIIENGR